MRPSSFFTIVNNVFSYWFSFVFKNKQKVLLNSNKHKIINILIIIYYTFTN